MFYVPCKIDPGVLEGRPLPTVTIVTPSYNQAPFLEATIRSVLAQDYPNIEYIIMDGGSTDGSREIIRRYAHRLDGWVSEPDGGQSDAVNKGFARASGEIFYWLNSDDLVMPSAVRIAVACLLSNPHIGMVFGDRLIIDAKDNVLGVSEHPSFRKAEMKYNLTLPQETAFFRRRCFEEAGGLDERLRYCMDYDLWVRMSRRIPVLHIPFILGAYRAHEKAKSSNPRAMRTEITEVTQRHFGGPRCRRIKKLFQSSYALRLALERRSRQRRIDRKRIAELVRTGGMNVDAAAGKRAAVCAVEENR